MVRKVLTECLAFLFIVLFVYAAISKLIDYPSFTVQISQSPMLTGLSDFLPWIVISVELLVAGTLIFPRVRLIGFYASFFLMIALTTYIITILNFSDHIPCSCGGILEKLGWTEHLIFNLVFSLFGSLGIILTNSYTNSESTSHVETIN